MGGQKKILSETSIILAMTIFPKLISKQRFSFRLNFFVGSNIEKIEKLSVNKYFLNKQDHLGVRWNQPHTISPYHVLCMAMTLMVTPMQIQ